MKIILNYPCIWNCQDTIMLVPVYKLSFYLSYQDTIMLAQAIKHGMWAVSYL